jgi:type I restriction enzyme S subunit
LNAALWPSLPFEAIVLDASGGNNKVQKNEYLPTGTYPIVDQGQELIGGYSDDETNLVSGAGPWVVFGDHTRAVKFLDAPFCMGADGVKVLLPRDTKKLDARFLYWFLVAHPVPSAGYSRHYKFLKRLDVPLPPLDEQRRIAAILNKADALRQKRKRAIALLDSLTQSIFLEMFGDLYLNSRGWPLATIGEVCDRVCVGIVVTPAAYYKPSGVPALRSLNIEVEGFKLNDLVFISAADNDKKLAKSRLRAGDVVVVRTGQPGKAAVVPSSLDGANAIDLLITTPNLRKIEPQFLSTLINSDIGKRLVMSEKRGQIQQHLNVGSLKSAVIPLPPIANQHRFVSARKPLVEAANSAFQALASAERLLSSLQHRAFAGQL